jgi:hypothetical protein
MVFLTILLPIASHCHKSGATNGHTRSNGDLSGNSIASAPVSRSMTTAAARHPLTGLLYAVGQVSLPLGAIFARHRMI